jgi:hypothetical protein
MYSRSARMRDARLPELFELALAGATTPRSLRWRLRGPIRRDRVNGGITYPCRGRDNANDLFDGGNRDTLIKIKCLHTVTREGAAQASTP